MGIQVGEVRQHWNYFLALEDDIVRLARYLEPTPDNFGAYSLELARILITAASEVDVVAKLFCIRIGNGNVARDINQYRNTIAPACPHLLTAQAHIPKFGLTLEPWEQWSQGKNPVWWKAYNNVKHHRSEHFSSACLHHALNSVAALYLMLLFLYREDGVEGRLNPDPTLFTPGRPFELDYPAWGARKTLYFFEGEQIARARAKKK